jgi:hypothetical protein
MITIFAVAFERRVESIRIDLGKAGEVSTHLSILNEKQKKNAAVRPFRFETFVVRGPFCLGEVSGFGVNGHEIYNSPPEECRSEGESSARVCDVVGYSEDGTELFSAETGLC